MMTVRMTRRRTIAVLAAAAGLPLALNAGGARAGMVRWDGTALGAVASIQLHHQDEARARAAVDAALSELARLEAIFSVHRADSAISALNRDGRLDAAPAEFVELLQRSLSLAAASEGVYDPTIQPVWMLYFRHFTQRSPNPAGPAAADLARAVALVDWRGVHIDGDRVSFAHPGMGLTLNGSAQGYITDRVAEVLRGHGFDRVLVDMGEPRALAAKPDGSAWRIGIADPSDPTRALTEVSVVDACVATSGGYGTMFDAAGRFTHLIDPRSGRTAPALEGVSVIAATATAADGLSTALLLAPPESRRRLLQAGGGQRAIYVTPAGVTATVDA
ncbi:FAD:protein FMN transferase [Magnetospirillum sp. UT-4]|uniref:FAD:protein FMN transferase n=1 Tax=Magnetospirillum sp. UT-4 TaxID=2681467 RepID=UPI0013845797|nr:FAD:protein FMN transferase [Magnetospirillum sp. UT-4]CAA7626415.1 Membrane-associated lipoprotein [Magnetospirillum sp. UT-4]